MGLATNINPCKYLMAGRADPPGELMLFHHASHPLTFEQKGS